MISHLRFVEVSGLSALFKFLNSPTSAVYEHILVAAAAMNQVPFILVSKLAKFITCFPREFLQQGGTYNSSSSQLYCSLHALVCCGTHALDMANIVVSSLPSFL